MKEEVHRRTIERTQKQKVTDGKKQYLLTNGGYVLE